jgi:hypothetical protein
MLRKMILALAFVTTFAATGLVVGNSADAHILRRRPIWGTYYYHNGPPRAFLGPPVRVYTNAYDIGPYGPGYGWPFPAPVGVRFYIGLP